MSAHAADRVRSAPTAVPLLRAEPGYQAYLLLRLAFTVAPITFGLVSGYYDVARRDFGLMLGALTLARLAWAYDPPGLRR